MKQLSIAWLFFLVSGLSGAARAENLDEQARQIAAELRCPVCQNLSVADSPSELAQQMRSVIEEQLKQGKTPDQIKTFFVSKYGEWVLLAPEAKGFSLLLWILPYAVVVAGIVLVILIARRWVRRRNTGGRKSAEPDLVARVRQEVQHADPPATDIAADSPGDVLQQERARIYGYMRELEFDYQAGKISQADYQELRADYEQQAVVVLKQLDSLPKAERSDTRRRQPQKQTRAVSSDKAVEGWRRGWVLAAGGALILIFGVTIGVLLSTSLKTRQSQSDTITGDFLTGTTPVAPTDTGGPAATPASGDFATLLAQGKSAFERNDLPQAIEAFKRALALNPNNPEPHAYMGLILSQAGHYDGALMAFDKALSGNPNFPLALWGKGMVLFHIKKDLAGARENLEKVLRLMPPGPEREEVQKTLLQINLPGPAPTQAVAQNRPAAAGTISGNIIVDKSLKPKINGGEALFIIARSAQSAGGPPLAVKKIEHPTFPVTYTLGQENVMMPGVSFSGKIVVSVRLDKDGNAATHQPGDLTGEYKNNPVEVGSQKVDIVIDKVM